MLCVLGEDLKEACVVHAMIIVVSRMHVEARFGHCTAAHVQHVGQALAHRRIQRLVHVRDTLARREIRCPESCHRHSGRHCRSGMFAFGFNENERPPGNIDMPCRSRFSPVLAHLRGRRNRIGTRTVRRFALTHNRGSIAVHRRTNAGVFMRIFSFLHGRRYSFRLG